MHRYDDTVADAIFARLALAFKLPDELVTHEKCSEPINILQYERLGEYTPHFDTGATLSDTASSRFLSAILYLNTVESGGGTSFPKSPQADGSTGLTVDAKKGRLMFFYGMCALVFFCLDI
jgi:hypothetical protein